jgi:type IV pilus assembly protein PilV
MKGRENASLAHRRACFALRPRRAARAGFTLVEVMIAISVMILGMTGYTLLQGASGRSIQGAQEHTVALQFQESWVERIQRDAMLWTQAGKTGLLNTQYLKLGAEGPTDWLIPAVSQEGNSGAWIGPAADFTGRDLSQTGPTARYCANFRFQPAHYWSPISDALPAATDIDMMRVDIRVWWSRINAGQGPVRTLLRSGDGGLDCDHRPTKDELLDPSVMKTVTFLMVRWQ